MRDIANEGDRAARRRGIHFRAVRVRHRLRETSGRIAGIPSRWRHRGTCRGEHGREWRPLPAHLRIRRRLLGADARRNATSRSTVRRRGQHRRTRPCDHLRARPPELVRSRIGDGTPAGGGNFQLQPAPQRRNPPCRRHSGRERRRARRPGRTASRWLLGVYPDERGHVRRSSENRHLHQHGYDRRTRRRIPIHSLGSWPYPRNGLQPRRLQRLGVLERGPLRSSSPGPAWTV